LGILEGQRKGRTGRKVEGHTRSRFISCIARSIFLTTADIEPVTFIQLSFQLPPRERDGNKERGRHTVLIVTAVSTLEATASILLDNLNKFKLSFFFLIAFAA